MNANPAGPFVAEFVAWLVKDVHENLSRLDDTRARPIEILVAVGQVDVVVLDGFQTRPTRMLGQQMQFLCRALDAEAAWHDDDEVRIGCDEIIPGHPRRVLTGFAEQRRSASELWKAVFANEPASGKGERR